MNLNVIAKKKKYILTENGDSNVHRYYKQRAVSKKLNLVFSMRN